MATSKAKTNESADGASWQFDERLCLPLWHLPSLLLIMCVFPSRSHRVPPSLSALLDLYFIFFFWRAAVSLSQIGVLLVLTHYSGDS